MATVVELDMQGIEGLRDEGADPVLFWFEELKERLGDPAAPGPDCSFDEQLWPLLPSLEELCPAPPMFELMRDLLVSASNGRDLDELLGEVQRMADVEYRIKKGREADDHGEGSDLGGSGADAGLEASAAGGGGRPVPGGSEDGDQVGEGAEPGKRENRRRSSKVPRGGRAGKTEGTR